ncbi:hypothetical protein [Kaarinaea lacus]
MLIALLLLTTSAANADRRKYQHGIDFIPLDDGTYWLLWSSSPGNPPRGEIKKRVANGEICKHYTHDIYYSRIDPDNPKLAPRTLVSLPEAQEPVSAAISAQTQILVTMEDGSDSDITRECNGIIQQRYQVFNSALAPISGFNRVAWQGGHSGHAAAVGDRFIIVYSEGWISGGGFNNQGTGNDIVLDVVDSGGQLLQHRNIAVDNGDPRDWWPLIAGSNRQALLLWQRYVKDSHRANLMYAVYNPSNNTLVKNTSQLQSEVYYYHYDVQYLPSINRFIVAGNHLGDMLLSPGESTITAKTQKAFIFLLDEDGTIIDRWSEAHKCEPCNSYHTHPLVREAQPAIHTKENIVSVLYPTKPKGALLFFISPTNVSIVKYIDDDYYWHSLGTDGIFLDDNTAYFATLSPKGIKTRRIDVQ